MMVAVGLTHGQASPPFKLVASRRLKGQTVAMRRGCFFIFRFWTLKRPAPFIGHSVTNSINSKSMTNHIYDLFCQSSGFNLPCIFLVAHLC
jgi:hypothetical protein